MTALCTVRRSHILRIFFLFISKVTHRHMILGRFLLHCPICRWWSFTASHAKQPCVWSVQKENTGNMWQFLWGMCWNSTSQRLKISWTLCATGTSFSALIYYEYWDCIWKILQVQNANLKVLFCVHLLFVVVVDYHSWQLPSNLWMRSPSSLRIGKMRLWLKSVTLLTSWRRPYTNARLLSLQKWKTSAAPSRRSEVFLIFFL